MATEQTFYVGVKGIICKEGKILVVRPSGSDRWELPGGRINRHEEITAALRREIYEELGVATTGLSGLVHTQLGQNNPSSAQQLLLLFFSIDAETGATLTLSSEHTAFDWIDLENAGQHRLFPSDKEAIRRFSARIYQ